MTRPRIGLEETREKKEQLIVSDNINLTFPIDLHRLIYDACLSSIDLHMAVMRNFTRWDAIQLETKSSKFTIEPSETIFLYFFFELLLHQQKIKFSQ